MIVSMLTKYVIIKLTCQFVDKMINKLIDKMIDKKHCQQKVLSFSHFVIYFDSIIKKDTYDYPIFAAPIGGCRRAI